MFFLPWQIVSITSTSNFDLHICYEMYLGFLLDACFSFRMGPAIHLIFSALFGICWCWWAFKELFCHFSHKMNQKEPKKRTPPRQEPGCDTPWWAEAETGQCALLPEPVSFLPAGLTLFWFCLVCKLITLPILRFHFPNYGGCEDTFKTNPNLFFQNVFFICNDNIL